MLHLKHKYKNPIRIVTGTSLFDGHDVSINVIRRILQDFGAEVIHLGHNRSVEEVVSAVLQEGVQGVCISSYQGGHMEYFKSLKDLLNQVGASYVKIFGGGGGVIVQKEKRLLERYGITQIFHPEDGRRLGLEGMAEEIMKHCDFDIVKIGMKNLKSLKEKNHRKPLSHSKSLELKTKKNQKQKPLKKGHPLSLSHSKVLKEKGDQKNDKENQLMSFYEDFLFSFPHYELGLLFSYLENEASLNLSSPSPSISSISKNQKDLKKNLFKHILSYKGFSNSKKKSKPLILGFTGTGGAGKSNLIDELLLRFLNFFPDIKIAFIAVDPTKKKTGGALLGDRLRMNALDPKRVYMRSQASRASGKEISNSMPKVLDALKQIPFDLILLESSGIGQASSAIVEVSDQSFYVMTSDFGAESQLEKIDMIDYADFIVINKADHKGGKDTLRAVKKQYQRSRKLFSVKEDFSFPIFLTQAHHFNDPGINQLFSTLIKKNPHFKAFKTSSLNFFKTKNFLIKSSTESIIPPERKNYLAGIVSSVRKYKKQTERLAEKASKIMKYEEIKTELKEDQLSQKESSPYQKTKKENLFFLDEKIKNLKLSFNEKEWETLQLYDQLKDLYKNSKDLNKNLNSPSEENKTFENKMFEYKVRGKKVSQPFYKKSLSHTLIPRVIFPEIKDWGERFRFLRLENVPGHFPFTNGVFPLKRSEEEPTRQFAGEGSPEKTNQRFHFLSSQSSVKRLSVAFDSVSLYGEDPHWRPDIFGKVGESGVSISNLEDMKKLFQGFDLCDEKTSVSMTINGPAPMILAFFFNTAIDQQIEKKKKALQRDLNEKEKEEIKKNVLKRVRGTVQADILKEDQSQNTCIFSIHFALKLMADIQEFFIQNEVKNFYSVSISGYHIAEAGANPITQLAFTLSNAFTYLEYYKARGLKIDDFASDFSFFFSNGLDPEYTVIGRVARRIWALAMKEFYGANERSQKLKYHIQTSGRSLHAQEMSFNDIRTTLQALMALQDHCNSLHTNAYDEALTTPTKESVRKAQAIQMILNHEFGLIKNENFLQGSFFVEFLTEALEEAVLDEFLRINERGGVLGGMETQYQRSKIQEESLYYETLKHSGDLPLIGVNTFLDPVSEEEAALNKNVNLTRSTEEEKTLQCKRTTDYKEKHQKETLNDLKTLEEASLSGKNIFEALMKASRTCSLKQMTDLFYKIGGRYRRNL